MTTWYLIFRIIGYVGGLTGLILFTLGRQDASPNSLRVTAGAILLIVGFAGFVASYAIYTLLQFRRRAERRAELNRPRNATPPGQ